MKQTVLTCEDSITQHEPAPPIGHSVPLGLLGRLVEGQGAFPLVLGIRSKSSRPARVATLLKVGEGAKRRTSLMVRFAADRAGCRPWPGV